MEMEWNKEDESTVITRSQQTYLQKLKQRIKETKTKEIKTYFQLKQHVTQKAQETIDCVRHAETTFSQNLEENLQSSLSRLDEMDKSLQQMESELTMSKEDHTEIIVTLLQKNTAHIEQIENNLTQLILNMTDYANIIKSNFSAEVEKCDLMAFSEGTKYSSINPKDFLHTTAVQTDINSNELQTVSIQEELLTTYVTFDYEPCSKAVEYFYTITDNLVMDDIIPDDFILDNIIPNGPTDINLACCKATFLWCQSEKNLPMLKGLKDVAFLPNSHVMVTSPETGCFHEFDTRGNWVRATVQPQMIPSGITLAPDNFVVVTDQNEKNMKAFTKGGDLVCTFANGYFTNPTCVWAKSQDVYVVVDEMDNWDPHVYIYSMMAGSKVQLGKKTENKLPFKTIHKPAFVTLDTSDNIYVSDTGSHAIKVFSLNDGKYVRHFGQQGDRESDLCYPTGLAVDSQGNLLVADSGNCRLSVFDSRGHFVTHLLGQSNGIEYPQAIALSSRGQLAVIQKDALYMYQLH